MGNIAVMDAGQEQHIQALEHANRVRLARAGLKRQIAAGETSVAEVIDARPYETETMSISDLLMSQKRWGRARCHRLLTSVGIPENKRIGTLTQRQRDALVAALAGGPVPALDFVRLDCDEAPSASRAGALSAA